jgi:hypothetical protein
MYSGKIAVPPGGGGMRKYMKNVCYLHHNGFLIFEQRLVCLTLRDWRHIQNLCGFSTPTAMGQSFMMTK